jgi:glycosyltransferase involved in cell wall biosynthesis
LGNNVLEKRRGEKLRLAFIGMRGLPADLPKAGGGERETEAKTIRLAKIGHDVTVYCRWHYHRHPRSPYKGIRLISLPSIPTKNLDTVTHSFLATIHAGITNAADIISYHGMGNALYVPLAKLFRKKTVVYMDGVDWERPKWGGLARRVLHLSARMAFRWADAVYVDNNASKRAFEKIFGSSAEVITLAPEIWEDPGSDHLGKFGLLPDKYILFVGLLKPDKGVHILVEAYKELTTSLPLVIVGDSPDKGEYLQNLKKSGDERIKFLGYVYGQEAQQLFANCHIYVQPSLMEGNSPALMSAMACGRCVVVSNIEQNLETIGDAGLSFHSGDPNSLRVALQDLLSNPTQVGIVGRKARERINCYYNWDVVVDQLNDLYQKIT